VAVAVAVANEATELAVFYRIYLEVEIILDLEVVRLEVVGITMAS
jgi:hypothetical protein